MLLHICIISPLYRFLHGLLFTLFNPSYTPKWALGLFFSSCISDSLIPALILIISLSLGVLEVPPPHSTPQKCLCQMLISSFVFLHIQLIAKAFQALKLPRVLYLDIWKSGPQIKIIICPGGRSSVDWALAWEPKGHWFDSQSGHMPGLQARSLVEGTWEATTHWCFSPFFLPFPSL